MKEHGKRRDNAATSMQILITIYAKLGRVDTKQMCEFLMHFVSDEANF